MVAVRVRRGGGTKHLPRTGTGRFCEADQDRALEPQPLRGRENTASREWLAVAEGGPEMQSQQPTSRSLELPPTSSSSSVFNAQQEEPVSCPYTCTRRANTRRVLAHVHYILVRTTGKCSTRISGARGPIICLPGMDQLRVAVLFDSEGQTAIRSRQLEVLYRQCVLVHT